MKNDDRRIFSTERFKKFVKILGTILSIFAFIAVVFYGLSLSSIKNRWSFCPNVANNRGQEYCEEMRDKELLPMQVKFNASLVLFIIFPFSFVGSTLLYKYIFPKKEDKV